MEPEILYSQSDLNGMAWAEVTLNRPDKGNALNMRMLDRLASIVAEIESARSLRAVVIRARGRFFCTGGDIEAWSALAPHDMGQDWILRGIEVFDRLAALPQPVIAALFWSYPRWRTAIGPGGGSSHRGSVGEVGHAGSDSGNDFRLDGRPPLSGDGGSGAGAPYDPLGCSHYCRASTELGIDHRAGGGCG